MCVLKTFYFDCGLHVFPHCARICCEKNLVNFCFIREEAAKHMHNFKAVDRLWTSKRLIVEAKFESRVHVAGWSNWHFVNLSRRKVVYPNPIENGKNEPKKWANFVPFLACHSLVHKIKTKAGIITICLGFKVKL